MIINQIKNKKCQNTKPSTQTKKLYRLFKRFDNLIYYKKFSIKYGRGGLQFYKKIIKNFKMGVDDHESGWLAVIRYLNILNLFYSQILK